LADDFVSLDIDKCSLDIPPSIKRLIGSGILEFSRLETIAEHILWDVLKLDYADAQLLIARLDASQKFNILKEILERRYPEAKDIKPKDSIWSAIRVLAETRNKIAHGNWIMHDGRPFILSHRWKGRADTVMAEPFPYERLIRVERLARNLTQVLRELSRVISSQPAASPPPPPPAS
jgi:hypothetical protein